MGVTGAAELESRSNHEERDVTNPEGEVPGKGTRYSQASPVGSKGPPITLWCCTAIHTHIALPKFWRSTFVCDDVDSHMR